ncbi:MAG: VOC family protein [Cytophagaceae bacterium]|nr:MAG: VOC family protein [Cytophagaceae bacterium]
MHFNGNCREAMTFYQECLGGELTLLPVGESPMAEQLPAQMGQHIMHASLKKDGLQLLASDMCVGDGEAIGHSISLFIDCCSDLEIRDLFGKLVAHGQVIHPLEDTFWGAVFGDLTDQFGFHWCLNFDKNQPV